VSRTGATSTHPPVALKIVAVLGMALLAVLAVLVVVAPAAGAHQPGRFDYDYALHDVEPVVVPAAPKTWGQDGGLVSPRHSFGGLAYLARTSAPVTSRFLAPQTGGSDDCGDYVWIYKAPPTGMGSVWLSRGFSASDFPGSPGGYPDGNAYFAKDLAIAQDFERREGYRDGVLAVQIPRRDYDSIWAQYEAKYASAPGGTELIIPNSVVSGLNGYPRFWPT
jgi:hypothetical protein